MYWNKKIETAAELEDVLSVPSVKTQEVLSRVDGDIVVLGAGGKMGPGLCRLIRRACQDRKVYAVSRFSDKSVKESLEEAGIETISADLLERNSYGNLPEASNVYYLAGMKFGADSDKSLTWAINAYMPALVCEKYGNSRIVALSTGNVYPFVGVACGADESSGPDPVGEYAQSCLGRERIFEYFSGDDGQRTVLIRLNYANEPRYGIIVDLTKKIMSGQAVDLSMGFVNLIWQGDVNNYIASSISIAGSPAEVLNLAGPETVSVRWLCQQIGRIVGKDVEFCGQESQTALLSNAGKCFANFGYPHVSLLEMIEIIVRWVTEGKEVMDKPTKFQVMDGRF